jgi:hypothetical protein
MSAIKRLYRIYKQTDYEMTLLSRVFLGLFKEEITKFSRFDPDFNDSYSQRWGASIKGAEDLIPDSSFKKEISLLREEVKTICRECLDQVKMMKFYIVKAFPQNREMWNTFGVVNYNRCRQNGTLMLKLLNTLYEQSVHQKEKLAGINCPAEEIEKVNLLKTGLDEAQKNLEAAKKARPLNTVTNISYYNEVWSYSIKVNKASKIIFVDNPAKIKMFELPKQVRVKKTALIEQPAQP